MVTDVHKKLGFDRLINLIAAETLSEAGKIRTLGLAPLGDYHAIIARMEKITALQKLLEQNSQLPLEPFTDIRPELKRCRINGSFLSIESLVEISNILKQGVKLRHFRQQNSQVLTPLAELIEQLDPLEPAQRLIRRVIKEDQPVKSGAADFKELIKDRASPALARIRQQIGRTLARLQQEIERIMQQARREQWLHEEQATIRDGRFVLPLCSESKRKIKGIIHGQSATGATVYVEPLNIVEINNAIKDLEMQEQTEIERILRILTDELRPDFERLVINLKVLTELDFLHACAGFAWRFRCTVPQLALEDRCLRLLNARHPLLSLVKEVVPLNLKLDTNNRCLIISGPNAGGKTVALKTIGLLSQMAMAGLPIPADEDSCLPFFDQFLIDIGDQQSLENDLSTFTSHVTNLKQFIDSANEESLVMIDELGTATDPLEGAALGQAVLEELLRKKTLTVVTTHHSGLKAFADKQEGVINAAMEFNTVELKPTYRLQLGLPGSSYALEIAQRLELKPAVIQRAKELMGSDQVKLENLLREVEVLRVKIAEENQSVERNKKTLDKLIREYEDRVAAIREKHEDIDRKIADELQTIVAESRSRIEHAVKDIREKEASRATIIEAKKTLEAIQEKIRQRLPNKPQKQQPESEEIQVNSWVKIEGVPGVGQIVELPASRQKAAVNIDGKLLWVSVDTLKIVEHDEIPPSATAGAQIQIESIPSYRLDLRGIRLDEARAMLEKFIDRALLSGLNEIEIVHGKGTGALQKMTHEVLKSTPGIRSFHFQDFDSGGTGVTIVEL
jgi:DNA mismatch repair protein MutS2